MSALDPRPIAWLAQDEGWSYWLDIVDLGSAPGQIAALKRWLGREPSRVEIAILTAAIIEMGLLNSSHVIAAMTGNTKGSQWVPYEYGRVKELPPNAVNAACWWDAMTLPQFDDLPEYLLLAPVWQKECEIRAWLQPRDAPRPTQPVSSVSRPTPERLADAHRGARQAALAAESAIGIVFEQSDGLRSIPLKSIPGCSKSW